ncbi:MAG: hypothetical protein JJT95_15350 [Pararhodobacter sp.]|nr:hypothetical protein [Pararhodobacter sp.]
MSENAANWSGFDYWLSTDCNPSNARQPGTGTPTALRESADRHGWWFWNDAARLGLDGALTLMETHQGAAWHSVHEGRVVRLSGQIAAGDAARLEAVFRDNDLLHCFAENYCPFNNVLSLDSPGGNLSEALEIARFVKDHQLPVLLEPDASCEAACAVIFLAGYTEYEGFFHSRRFAHVTARLGLRRPDLPLPAEAFASVEAEELVALSDTVTADVLRHFLAARVAMPVLQQMYDAQPEMTYRLSVPEMEGLATVFHHPDVAAMPSRAGVLSLCAGRYQQSSGHIHDDLLANLELREDSFITWLRHGDFACYGARETEGGWVYDICSGQDRDDCALVACSDVYANPDSACAPILEAANSWFIETVQNRDLGMAIAEANGALRHALTRAALLEHGHWRVAPLRGWTESAPVPAAYCGALDFRAPEIARLIQERLTAAGFETGPVDGLVGPRTFEQIHAAGRALLGRELVFPDAALLEALGVAKDTVEGLLLCAEHS